jgi:mannitol-1-/sugar-/sorbitol-6-phosphatase
VRRLAERDGLTHLPASGLLLDMDGVLVDSTGAVERHWAMWADRRGVPLAEVLRYGHGSPSREVVARFVPPEDVAAEADWVEGLVREPAEEHALPGALIALSQGLLPVAIVTSATTEVALIRLGRAGLPIPDVLVSADDVVRGKPDPEPYRLGAALLGVPAELCVGVDDTAAGVASIRGCGAAALALSTTYPASELTEALVCLPNLAVLQILADGICW